MCYYDIINNMDSQKYLIGLHYRCNITDTNFRSYKKLMIMETNNADNILNLAKNHLDNFCKSNNYTSYKLYSCDAKIFNFDNEQYMKTIYN